MSHWYIVNFHLIHYKNDGCRRFLNSAGSYFLPILDATWQKLRCPTFTHLPKFVHLHMEKLIVWLQDPWKESCLFRIDCTGELWMHFLHYIGKMYIRGIFICKNITSIPLSCTVDHLTKLSSVLYSWSNILIHRSFYAASFMLKHFSEWSVTSTHPTCCRRFFISSTHLCLWTLLLHLNSCRPCAVLMPKYTSSVLSLSFIYRHAVVSLQTPKTTPNSSRRHSDLKITWNWRKMGKNAKPELR